MIHGHCFFNVMRYVDLIQDVIMQVSTAVTVTFLVPSTAKTACVTYKTELVLHVNLDGLEWIVRQVR